MKGQRNTCEQKNVLPLCKVEKQIYSEAQVIYCAIFIKKKLKVICILKAPVLSDCLLCQRIVVCCSFTVSYLLAENLVLFSWTGRKGWGGLEEINLFVYDSLSAC